MLDYLTGLVGALGIADQRKRKEIASDMEKALTTPDARESDQLRDKVRGEISAYGRLETASGKSDELMTGLENGISAMLLKEGRFFRSYAIVVAVHARKTLLDTQVAEINKTMRRLAGSFTNILIQSVESEEIDGYEVRVLSIGLHETDRVK